MVEKTENSLWISSQGTYGCRCPGEMKERLETGIEK
jgi:hypothetical protein